MNPYKNNYNCFTFFYSHGANPTIRNKENLTPCELASKLGHKRLVSLFANHLGSGLLAPLVKRQSQTSLNT